MEFRIKFSDPVRYFVEGAEVSKRQFYRARQTGKMPKVRKVVAASETGIIGCGNGWPLKLLSLKAHPKQAQQMRDRAKRHGISVEYTNEGHPIIPDLGNYKKLMALEGVHQRNSFYGS